MSDSSEKKIPIPDETDNLDNLIDSQPAAPRRGVLQVWQSIVKMGLGEMALRIGAGLASIALVLMVVWVMSTFYLKGNVKGPQTAAAVAAADPTAVPVVKPPMFEPPDRLTNIRGILRIAQLHTTLPSRPRFEMTTYTVQKGDNIYDIAERFSLNPRSLMWSNPTKIYDAKLIQPGMELEIPPVDGVVYEWHEGDGLNGVAEFFKVTPEEIINWPGNKMVLAQVGDFANPNIEPGKQIFVPNGIGQFINWTMPAISRSNPAVARSVGPGFCGTVYDGAMGFNTFVWPAATTYISGYRYDPDINHLAIDIGGSVGVGIYASDSGVVVYAGWNDFGYGYLIVIDHGTGWQTYYAHLSSLNVGCGQSVGQGEQIGLMGSTGNSTGPHLHFEMRSDLYGKVDPLNFISP